MKTLITGAVAISLMVQAAWAGPHVHGHANLDIVIDPPATAVRFSAPLASLVGFEHRPETAAEAARVKKMQASLNQPENLIQLPAEADCSLSKVVSQAPFSAVPKHAHSQEAEHHHDSEAHADMEVEYHYVCGNSDALTQLSLPVFRHHPGIEQLKLQFLAPDRQHHLNLTPSDSDVTLP